VGTSALHDYLLLLYVGVSALLPRQNFSYKIQSNPLLNPRDSCAFARWPAFLLPSAPHYPVSCSPFSTGPRKVSPVDEKQGTSGVRHSVSDCFVLGIWFWPPCFGEVDGVLFRAERFRGVGPSRPSERGYNECNTQTRPRRSLNHSQSIKKPSSRC
jgi:hypothetical protein